MSSTAAALGVGARAHEGGAGLVFLAISLLAATLCTAVCAVVVCCCQTRCSFSYYGAMTMIGTLLQVVGFAGFVGEAAPRRRDDPIFHCRTFPCHQLLVSNNLTKCQPCATPDKFCDPIFSSYYCTVPAYPGLADCGLKFCADKIDDCSRGGGSDGVSIGFETLSSCETYWHSKLSTWQYTVELTLLAVALAAVLFFRVGMTCALLQQAKRPHVGWQQVETQPLRSSTEPPQSDMPMADMPIYDVPGTAVMSTTASAVICSSSMTPNSAPEAKLSSPVAFASRTELELATIDVPTNDA